MGGVRGERERERKRERDSHSNTLFYKDCTFVV